MLRYAHAGEIEELAEETREPIGLARDQPAERAGIVVVGSR